MRLAIADPPYLGRAALWYGGRGRNKQGRAGRACGRGDLASEYHPEAAHWDDPDAHTRLVHRLERDYDGWALAASAKTITQIRIPERARIAIWHVTNAIPDGSRIHANWEAVIFRTPEGRRAHGSGPATSDVLRAPHPMSGFVGSKPEAWVHWVLDLLGFDSALDEVEDIFPGSGAVGHALGVLF